MPGVNYQHKSSISLFLRCQNACTGAIFQGYTLSEMLFTGSHILIKYGFEIFDMSKDDKTVTYHSRLMNILIGPILCLAGLLTTYFTPYFTTKIERRKCMIIADIIFLIATICTQIPYWQAFMAARILMGITCGMDQLVVPLYIREVSPDNMAAKTGSQFQANISLGIIIGFLVSLPVEEVVSNDQHITNSWRLVFIFPAIFSIQRLIGLIFVYKIDTPYYYYRDHQLEKGRLALQEIYQDKFILKIEQSLLGPGSIDFPDLQIQERARSQNTDLSTTSVDYNQPFSDSGDKLTNEQEMSYKNRLRVGLFINIAQQMSGCTALAALSPGIIGQFTSDYETLRCIIFGSFMFLFFVAVLGVGFNRKLARKRYLVGGFLLCSIFQFCLSFACFDQDKLKQNRTVQFIYIMFIFCFYAAYNFTIGPVAMILTSDILKDRGFSYSVMMNWLGTFLSISLLLNPIQWINHTVYGTFAFLGFLFSMRYIVETKWLNFNDVQNIYRDPKAMDENNPESQNEKSLQMRKYIEEKQLSKVNSDGTSSTQHSDQFN